MEKKDEIGWLFGKKEDEGDVFVKPSDYIENLGIPIINLNDSPHIVVCAKTRSGKSFFINLMLKHHFLHCVPWKNIVVFSPSYEEDKSYQDTRWTLKKLYDMEKIPVDQRPFKKFVDLDLIKKIVEKQGKIKTQIEEFEYKKKVKQGNVGNALKKKSDARSPPVLEKYLIIVDDLCGDKAWSSFGSEMSNFCTRSRHWNICFIWVGQVYTKIDSAIRSQADLFISLYQCPVKQKLFQEMCDEEYEKEGKKLFTKLIKHGAQYNVLLCDMNGASQNHVNTWILLNQKTKKIELYDPETGQMKNEEWK